MVGLTLEECLSNELIERLLDDRMDAAFIRIIAGSSSTQGGGGFNSLPIGIAVSTFAPPGTVPRHGTGGAPRRRNQCSKPDAGTRFCSLAKIGKPGEFGNRPTQSFQVHGCIAKRYRMHRMTRRRGRPPKPIAVHRLQGTFEPGRHKGRSRAEPLVSGDIPHDPPEWLTHHAQQVWRAVVPYLVKGSIGGGDLHLMASYCDQTATHQRAIMAQAKIDGASETPFLAKGREGQVIASPYIAIIRRSALAMSQLGSELGIGPTARARIGAILLGPDAPAAPGGQREDPWSAFEVIPGGKRT